MRVRLGFKLARRGAWLAILVCVAGQSLRVGAAEISATLVDAKDEPVPNAVLWLEPLNGKAPVLPGGSLHAVMDQLHEEFVPHVLVVEAGTSVNFPNSDNIHHDVYSFSPAKTFELPLYKGVPAKPVIFDTPGVVVLGCNIHDWMLGYIVVASTPWFAKSNGDGLIQLRNAPAGHYRLVLWQPDLVAPDHRLVQPVTLDSQKPVSLKFRLDLKPPLRMQMRSGGMPDL